MSGRFKPYGLIVLGMLLAAFLLNPPVALATKLPKACNVFHPQQINKTGPCGHQALFSKDKTHEIGIFPIFPSGLEIIDSKTDVINLPLSPVLPAIFPDSLPLRC
jgi:hypothetical protein